MSEKKQLGRILLRQKAVSPEQLDQALESPGEGRLASKLMQEGAISGLAALKALSEQYGIPGLDLEQVCVKLSDLELLPRDIAERHLILPVLSRGDRLFVAMANPREKKVIDELEFVTGKRVYPYVALESPLSEIIHEAYDRKARGDAYYIGPNCPAETLEKLGIDAQTAQASRGVSRPPIATYEDQAPGMGAQDSDGQGSLGRAAAARGSTGKATLNSPTGASASDSSAQAMGDAALTPARFAEALDSEVTQETPGVTADGSEAEVEDEDFGDLNSELSAVTDLPEQLPAAAGAPIQTILIVDDEAEIRRMLDKLLSGKGYRVLQADAGYMALKMVKEHTPDLMVLDAMLPEIHGFDIARRIKGSKRYGHIPIVMVSAVYRGWHYAEDLKQSCGVEAFIEKPFRIGEVVDAVDSALRGRASRPLVDADQMHQEAEQALTEGVAAYKAGNIDRAVELLQGGVEIDPLAYRLHFHLGLLHGRKGQVFDAIAALEKAVEINSKHFPAVKNLAILYQKAGFKNKAAEMWHKAAVIAPDDETRETVKNQLMSLL